MNYKMLLAAMLTLMTSASQASLVLQNDMVVGGKFYMHYSDLVRLGNPIGTSDDEGYCVIEDAGLEFYNNLNKSRILSRGTILEIVGNEGSPRFPAPRPRVVELAYPRPTQNLVVDAHTIVSSPRGLLKIGCSIDSAATEKNPYRYDATAEVYFETIGLKRVR